LIPGSFLCLANKPQPCLQLVISQECVALELQLQLQLLLLLRTVTLQAEATPAGSP
jgi:hypothetical protein